MRIPAKGMVLCPCVHTETWISLRVEVSPRSLPCSRGVFGVLSLRNRWRGDEGVRTTSFYPNLNYPPHIKEIEGEKTHVGQPMYECYCPTSTSDLTSMINVSQSITHTKHTTNRLFHPEHVISNILPSLLGDPLIFSCPSRKGLSIRKDEYDSLYWVGDHAEELRNVLSYIRIQGH
jgi:hypothetical protein